MSSDLNESRVKFVEQLFGMSGMPLSVPNRELIGEGVLLKICRKKPKHRHFFLFNDILIYGRIVIYKKKLVSQHIFPLETLRAEETTSSSANYDENSDISASNYYPFQIITPCKSFVVLAASKEERTQWLLHIRRAIVHNETNTNTYNEANNTKILSPVWIPDHRASKCMNCNITEFTLIQRRHHCRSCGHIVCSKCSQERIILPNQSEKPLRVCIRCYMNQKNSTSQVKRKSTSGKSNPSSPDEDDSSDSIMDSD